MHKSLVSTERKINSPINQYEQLEFSVMLLKIPIPPKFRLLPKLSKTANFLTMAHRRRLLRDSQVWFRK